MQRVFVSLALVALLGCSSNIAKTQERVEVEGRVTHKGKPVADVILNLQPTGNGAQASFPVKGGSFKGSVVPGKYTYYVAAGSKAASLKGIPVKYHEGSLDRQIDVASGSALNLTLD